jgi:phage gp36-like protein
VPYLDADGYKARFGDEELPQVTASSPSITLDQAIADASSIVDSYLVMIPNRTFAVPLATTPKRVAELTADLARYEIHSRKVTHEIKRRRDQAIAWLEALVKGLVAIPELLPDADAPPTEISGAVFERECEPVFTCCNLREYVGR